MSTSIAISPRSPLRGRGSQISLAWLIGWCLLGTYLIASSAGLSIRRAQPGSSSPFLVPSSLPASESTASPLSRTKPIQDVRIGDLVLALDIETGRLMPRRVLKTYQRVSSHLRILRFRTSNGDEEELRTTDEHPFWVQDEGWVEAGKLAPGTRVLETDGATATVTATRREEHVEGISVFNFQVEGLHNYFVAEGASFPSVLVHNAAYDLKMEAPGGPNYEHQKALRQLIDEATNSGNKPLSIPEANTILDWAAEYKHPWWAGPGDVGTPGTPPKWTGGPHINIPGAGKPGGHVPVVPGVPPRLQPD